MRKWINPVLVAVNVILLVTIGRAYLAEKKGESVPVQQDYETERPADTFPESEVIEDSGVTGDVAEEKSGGENEERPEPESDINMIPADEPDNSGQESPEETTGPGDGHIFSTSEKPDISDFGWVNDNAIHGNRTLPEGRICLEALEEIREGWKCYLIDDPDHQYGSTVERLLNVSIDGDNENVEVTFDWYFGHNTAADQVFEENMPDSVFTGTFADGTLSALGPGSINITDFYYLGGKEFAVGSMKWPDSIPAVIFLVRP